MKSYPEIKRLRWKQLPDAITRRYRFIPVKVEVDEQNIILACMPQIRRTYGKGGSSKEPAPWKSGICVTDGYQVYHTLEKEREDLTIAGCWAHARRRSTGKKGNVKDLPSEERLARRQATIKPLVDALFAYLKQHENEVGADKCLCRIWWKNRDIFGGQYEAHEPVK